MFKDESDILTACALRFDGYKYAEKTRFDYNAELERFVATGRWPEKHEEQLTLFFTLQRFLMKWGGECESKQGRYWRAFRELFLKVHEYPIPRKYRHDKYDTEWQRRYHPHLAECTRLIRRIHDTTAYDDNAPQEVAGPDVARAHTPTQTETMEKMTATPYRKKMIEVALPLEAINVASAREKSIRHGHPSTLHLWWARRPLAACRAVLFASLVDDPDSDPAYAHYDAETREHMAGEKRQQLFDLITELVQWENSNNELVINAARAEIARCVASRKIELGELKKDHKLPGGETVYDLVVKGHGDLAKLRDGKTRLPNAESVNFFLAEFAPPSLDPFCGGGAIPLEAQRLGLRAYASDLNPVPVLITKALIEIPPKFANRPPVNPDSHGEAGPAGKRGATRGKSVTGQSEWRGAQGLAEDVRYYGKWMLDEAVKRIGKLYPKIRVTPEMAKGRPDLKSYINTELPVIAWLWARTVISPNPALAGARVPLIRSHWLCKKSGKEAWVQPLVDKTKAEYTFEVRTDLSQRGSFDPSQSTVDRRGATCVLSGQPIPLEHIRSEGRANRLGYRMMAIVAEGSRGRVYLPPNREHEELALSVKATGFPETSLPEQALV